MTFFFLLLFFGTWILLFFAWYFFFQRVQNIGKRRKLHPWFVGVSVASLCAVLWSRFPTTQSLWQIGLLGFSMAFYIINRTKICDHCGAFLNKPGWFRQFKECPRCGGKFEK